MPPRRSAPPLWFACVVAAALALACRLLISKAAAHGIDLAPAPDVQYGFWTFLVVIAGAIWKGIQQAGKITLQALAWSVKALWWFATTTANGLKVVGQTLLTGLKKAWEFLKLTYDNVLKPAFLKLKAWYVSFKTWLENTFGPVLRFIKAVRDNIICFYNTWVRPWIEVIDITRRILRVFAALGLDWAKKLDARLGEISELIDRPFRLIIGKLNEAIGIINRVITADGLFQRIALLGSLARDMRYAWKLAVNWRHSPMTEADYEKIRKAGDTRTDAEIRRDFAASVDGSGGPYRSLISEAAFSWRKRFAPQ